MFSSWDLKVVEEESGTGQGSLLAETPTARRCLGAGRSGLCPWLCVAVGVIAGDAGPGGQRATMCGSLGSHRNGGCSVGVWGGTQQNLPGAGRLQSCLGEAERSHPAPQPSLKREVESNYWGLKRGGKGRRGGGKLKGEQQAACAERRTCHRSYQL